MKYTPILVSVIDDPQEVPVRGKFWIVY